MLFGIPWLFKNETIEDLDQVFQTSRYASSPVDARAKVQICVIDDELFYPLQILRDHGFSIAQIGDISSLKSIDPYDIVACDLRGVGEKFNDKLQGASIIQEIKKHRPEKYIIAYSGSFDRSNMAKLAHDHSDKKLVKSADIDKWTSTLDEGIAAVTNPVEKWKRIRRALNEQGAPTQTIMRLEHIFCKSVKKGDKSLLIKEITKEKVPGDIRPIVQGLISSAIWELLK